MSAVDVAVRPAREGGFGIYVHWPFCAQKCPYCDFNSHVRFKGWDEAQFLSAYSRELETFAHHTPNVPVSSIFFGGGTPSLMQGATVGAILDHIAKLWPVAPDAEVTLEANPGSVEAGRFRDYRAAGINRVSIGVQSLIAPDLKALGRIHSVEEAKSAIAIADKSFDRFSFDLIYARPGQTTAAWREELHQALARAGGHLSLYQLTIEEGTPFADRHKRGQLVVPDEDQALALFDVTQELTSKAGFTAYEISNHARPGEESAHNLIYWRYGDYVGVGPGAHGRVMWDGAHRATVMEPNPEAWCSSVLETGHGLSQNQELTPLERADEMLMMGLRLTEGVECARYTALSGRAFSQDTVSDLVEQGFIMLDPTLLDVPASHAPYPPTDGGHEKDALFGGEIAACVGPGMGPAATAGSGQSEGHLVTGRLRVTAKGRFVLNQIVYHLASSTIEVGAGRGRAAPAGADKAR